MRKNIVIIGGGIIGLCSAYYLKNAGHDVTIIDQGDLTDGCSFGNAGMIVPSHFIPLAAPGMISKGIRWMFNPTSPFYIRPRMSAGLIRWGVHFYRNATEAHVNRAIPVLKDISLLSKSMYGQLAKELPFDFGYQERGLLMLFKTKETEAEEKVTVRIAGQQGMEAHMLSAAEVQKLEPDVEVSVRGGVFFPGDAHLNPRAFMNGLISLLRQRGVTIRSQTAVTDFMTSGNQVKEVVTSNGAFSFDELILAAGSWSGGMARKLRLNLPMQAGKGYSITLTDVSRNIRIPSILLEARVSVTPMGNMLRFGGTMEISGVDHSINLDRVRGIIESIPLYYPRIIVEMPTVDRVWHGLRPCSPDGLPFIGRSKIIDNLVIATGHAMMGLSLGPGTGKLVSEIVGGIQPGMDLRLFDPERFSK